jgi:hypothetical protein
MIDLRLEAAIGIEPMNKGFAEIFWHRSPKDTEEQVRTKTTT